MNVADLWGKQIRKKQVIKLAHTRAKEIVDSFIDTSDRKGTSYFHSLAIRGGSAEAIEKLIKRESERKSVRKYWFQTDGNETLYDCFSVMVMNLKDDLSLHVSYYKDLSDKEKTELFIMTFQEICHFIAHYYWFENKKMEVQ